MRILRSHECSTVPFLEQENWLLTSMGIATIILEIWMIWEAIIGWRKMKNLPLD